MKADDFNEKECVELMNALRSTSVTESVPSNVRELIDIFFDENKEIDYNEFLTLYNEKYGNIINQYREHQKVQAIEKIRFAASLYIITFFIGLVIGIIWFFLGYLSEM
jgi:hypothetical protein